MEVVETSVESLDLGTILPTSQLKEEEDRIDCLEQQLSELQSWFSAMEARLDVSGLHAITCLEDVEDSLARHQTITEQIHGRQQDIDQLLLLCADLLHKPAVRMCSPLSLSFSDTSCQSPDLTLEEQTPDKTSTMSEGTVPDVAPNKQTISSGQHTEGNVDEDVCTEDQDGTKQEDTPGDSSLHDTLPDDSLMSVDMLEGEEEEDEDGGDSLQLLAVVLELRWNTVTMAANDIQCRLEEKLNTYKGIYRCALGPEPQYADEARVTQITPESTIEEDYTQGSDVIDSQSILSLNDKESKTQDSVEFAHNDAESGNGSSDDKTTSESNGDVIPFPVEDYEKLATGDSRDSGRDSVEVVNITQTVTVETVSRTVTVTHDPTEAEQTSRVSTDSLDRIPVKESSVLAPGPGVSSDPDTDDSLNDDLNPDSHVSVGQDDEDSNLHGLDTKTNDKEPSPAEGEGERHDQDEMRSEESDCASEDDMDLDSLGSGGGADDEVSEEEQRRKQQEEEVRERLRKASHARDPTELAAAMEQWQEAGLSTDEDIYVSAQDLARELEIQNVLRDAVRRRSLADIEKAMKLVREQGLSDRLRVDMAEAERVAESLRLLEKLRHEVLQLNQSTISEIRSYSNPPKPVHKVMLATFLLLGEDASNMKSWQEVRLLVGKTGKENLKRRVQQCDVKKIRPEVAGTARRILNKFDLDQLRDVSAGAAAFFIWAQGMVREVEERQKDAELEKEAASKATADS